MIPLPNPLSHAYLISGGAGDSRAALARRLTAAYLCQGSNPPCGTCRACRKAAAGAHPDVSLTAPLQGKQEISVEQIRALRSDVYVRPNEGARKVYVIHPADVMNPSAQNALLKVLEEGPAYAAFLLLAGEPGRLLDTVRSRCEPLRLPPEEAPPDPALADKAAALAQVLLTGGELAAAQALVALELDKPKPDQLAALLRLVERRVSQDLARHPQRGAKVLQALKTCRDNGAYNPGAGLTLGLLITNIF